MPLSMTEATVTSVAVNSRKEAETAIKLNIRISFFTKKDAREATSGMMIINNKAKESFLF